MNKWMVPVASFALALVLAMVAGPKTKLLARDPGGPTAPGTCVDLHNLYGVTLVSKTTADAAVDINFLHALPATKTGNTVGYTCKVALKYKVMSNGVEVTRPLEVELLAKPPLWQKVEVDVVDTKIGVAFRSKIAEFDKAI